MVIMLYIQICIGKKLLEQGRTIIRMTLPLQVLDQNFLMIRSHNLGQKSFRQLANANL